jgi:hypothetical protein
MHVTISTHDGSASLTNLTVGEPLQERRAIVVAVFVPAENDTDEAGELVYHRSSTTPTADPQRDRVPA